VITLSGFHCNGKPGAVALHLVGTDVAKISTNKLSTLVSFSLHVFTLRQGPLKVIPHFKLLVQWKIATIM
jgi:hypothetical protein